MVYNVIQFLNNFVLSTFVARRIGSDPNVQFGIMVMGIMLKALFKYSIYKLFNTKH